MPYLELFLLFSLLYMADCQTRNHSLPIRLPNAPLSTSCPLRRDPSLVKEILDEYYPPCPCGGVRGWTRAVHLDMSDRNQQCPSNWTLVTTPIRGCGRTNRNQGVCDSVTYPVHGRTYSQVCGRVLAYQKGWPSALYNSLRPSSSFALEEAYLSGVSLTHGPPDSRQHIWSFIAGEYELDDGRFKSFKCPCSTTNWSYQVPSFIDNNYFCDSGNPGPNINTSTYYTENPLWDGQGCGLSSTCCEFNSPPWFCISLPQPTSEDLEIRNCYTSFSTQDTIISSLDIHVK